MFHYFRPRFKVHIALADTLRTDFQVLHTPVNHPAGRPIRCQSVRDSAGGAGLSYLVLNSNISFCFHTHSLSLILSLYLCQPAVFDWSLKATVLTCPALNRRQPKQCNKRHCGSEHIWHRHGGREEEEHKEKEKKETERQATSGRAGNLGFSSRSECKV